MRPPGFTISAQRATNRLQIGDVLDHLHGEHDVEALAGIRERLGGGRAVVDAEPGLAGMQPRRRDIGLRRVRADDGGAEPCQRLAQNTAAAADIEHAQTRQRIEPFRISLELPASGLLDETEPHRIELVQHGHLAARIPPLAGQSGETRDFRLVDARIAPRLCLACHRPLPRRGCGPPASPVCIPAFSRVGLP